MVDFILRPEPGVEKKVLDIGQSPCLLSVISLNSCLTPSDFQGVEVVFGKRLCSSFIYPMFNFVYIFPRPMAMASRYPHVEVIGTDLAPAIMKESDVPFNCRFELDDVNRGLPHFYDQMDLVHMRAVSGGVSPCFSSVYPSIHRLVTLCYILSATQVTNFAETARELIRCLKPGGMLILAEGDCELNKEDQAYFAEPADPNNCTDATQGGKTWLTHKAHGMCSIPSSVPIDTISSANITNLSDVLQQRS